MAKINNPRRRPLTPRLKLSREHLRIDPSAGATGETGQTSPPETPTASPPMARKPQHSGPFYRYSRPLAQDPNIKPVGNGHQFSYQRVLGPEQLSPRSSSSESSEEEEESDDDSSVSDVAQPRSIADSSIAESSDDEDSELDGEADDDEVDRDVDVNVDVDVDDGDDEDDGSEEEDSEDEDAEPEAAPNIRLPSELGSAPRSLAGSEVEDSAPHPGVNVISTTATFMCDFVIEDIDPMDSGCEGLEVLFPTEIESNRSRSRSRHKEFDKGMMRDFKNLNCSNETSDIEPEPEPEVGIDEETLFRKRQKEIRRIRRVSMSSSFGKRTHSELSDSDDSEAGGLDVNDVGSSARRMRKRLHRGSLLFQDPPAPRIDELEEPDSSEDEYAAADPLARELPYWTMEIMEMESA